jgi:hypothetical protein
MGWGRGRECPRPRGSSMNRAFTAVERIRRSKFVEDQSESALLHRRSAMEEHCVSRLVTTCGPAKNASNEFPGVHLLRGGSPVAIIFPLARARNRGALPNLWAPSEA